MPWTTHDIPDLSGKVCVVTGATSGLGLASADALAGAGAHVVLAARNAEKAQRVRDEILASDPVASLEIIDLDLGSLASVQLAAARIVAHHPTIDILINNAGLMATPEGRTADGFETQLGVNHFGHWALTAGLLPALLAVEAARVVTVTSAAHHIGKALDPENLTMESTYNPWAAYCRSKLANYHFALGLQQEFEKRGLTAQSLVAHPGLSDTNLPVLTVEQGGGGRSAEFWKWLAARAGMSADRGALPQLRAATDPKARGGRMYAPRFINSGTAVRRPTLRPGRARAVATLWEVSERETGVALDFGDLQAG